MRCIPTAGARAGSLDRMRLMTATAVVLCLLVSGCSSTSQTSNSHDSPDLPTPTSVTSLPAESATPVPVAETVSFTFQCGYFDASGAPVDIDQEFLSVEDAWAYVPATTYCQAIKHGTEYTDVQREAVALAGDVLPFGIDQLDSLYSQCAMRANGYLDNTELASNQAKDVRGFLALCPDHPGADHLRSLLASAP